MADITMCREKDCPRSKECYRFTATPNEHWQSYLEKPVYDENGCKHFWRVKSEEGR